jgi:formate hydrogenlyase subunit 3/multisubunit Na+/H+ antiporter MnhD subunit
MTLALAGCFAALIAAVVSAAWSSSASAWLGLTGAALLAAVGLTAAAGGAHPGLGVGSWLGFGTAHLRADGLSGVFLALTGLAGAAVSVAVVEQRPRRLMCALHALVLLACATFIAADNAFWLFLAWETLTVALYLLTTADRERPGTLVAGYFSAGLTKLGGGALLAAIGLLYGRTGSFSLDVWSAAMPHVDATAQGVAFLLLLVAFGTKVGAFPLHGALPVSYSAAPGLGAATISVALAAGFYGLWRLVFVVLEPSLWWGELLVVGGGLTAFAGIVYAITQDEVRRFLGFSTVEHTGIALVGFGVALIGAAAGKPELAAAGLLAATLQVVAHGLAKTLALIAGDRLERGSGERDLLRLGGLGRRLPKAAAGLGTASLTLAAVPPFAGFVSEWMTFMALLQGFRVDEAFARLAMALAAALLALTAGLGLLAFAKLYGFAFLGPPRAGGRPAEPADIGAGLAGLAVLTAALGVAAPWEIGLLGAGLAGALGFDPAGQAISHPLVLGPVYPDFSVLAPTWLAIALPAFALVAATLARRTGTPVRRAPVWVTGSGAELAAVQYRPAAYSNPLRVVLQGPLGFQRRLLTRPAGHRGAGATLVLESHVVMAADRFLYRPVTAAMLRASAAVRRLQSGRLSAYLLYMLVVLLLVLTMIPTLR